MGRWLDMLRESRKNTETPSDETDKTPETPPQQVSSVLSARHLAENGKKLGLVSGPGVTIRPPAVEVSAAEYDAHLDRMIAEAEANAAEARFLAYVKTRGWVVPRGGETIFTRGR